MGYRYSTALKRWQTEEDGGWMDYGQQVIPDGWVDTQAKAVTVYDAV